MIRRLRKQFIRITMLSITIVMLLLSLIVNVANFISIDADLNELLDIICENQGTIPAHKYPFTDRPLEDSARREPAGRGAEKRLGASGGPFDRETPYSTRYFYLRFDENGTLDMANLEHIAAITREQTDEYVAVALAHGVGYGYYNSYKYRVIQHGENRYMAVFLNCYQEMHVCKVLAACSVLAVAACVALVYILVVLFSKRATEPVVRSVERQKQFITDASHELKTPITVIATSLKILEMEVGRQKWIDKSKAQTEQLKNLVNSLVTLSRMDEEQPPLKFEQFSISYAVNETAESFRDFAASNNHELQTRIASGLDFYGDEYAIRQLVSILLENAVKYAIPDTAITLSLEQERKALVIRIANECEGICPDDLDKLFDRFYRADKSRNTSTGGFGIGLSIARSIAESHKGAIRAVRPAENKIEFVVELKK